MFKALINAFKAPQVPKAATAPSPSKAAAPIPEKVAVPLAIAGALPMLPITKTPRDPFSIEDRVLNPINPLAVAGADPLKANIWWD